MSAFAFGHPRGVRVPVGVRVEGVAGGDGHVMAVGRQTRRKLLQISLATANTGPISMVEMQFA